MFQGDTILKKLLCYCRKYVNSVAFPGKCSSFSHHKLLEYPCTIKALPLWHRGAMSDRADSLTAATTLKHLLTRENIHVPWHSRKPGRVPKITWHWMWGLREDQRGLCANKLTCQRIISMQCWVIVKLRIFAQLPEECLIHSDTNCRVSNGTD